VHTHRYVRVLVTQSIGQKDKFIVAVLVGNGYKNNPAGWGYFCVLFNFHSAVAGLNVNPRLFGGSVIILAGSMKVVFADFVGDKVG